MAINTVSPAVLLPRCCHRIDCCPCATCPATLLGTQVGSVGEEQAAQYLLHEAQKIAADAAAHRPDLVAEAARESVSSKCR